MEFIQHAYTAISNIKCTLMAVLAARKRGRPHRERHDGSLALAQSLSQTDERPVLWHELPDRRDVFHAVLMRAASNDGERVPVGHTSGPPGVKGNPD